MSNAETGQSEISFSFSLLNATTGSNGLEIWQSGTISWKTSSSGVEGAFSLPGFYKEPIAFTGSTAQAAVGTQLTARGKSSEAEATFTLTFGYDGFLYSGSYLGGLMTMLDYSAQETYLYVMQGVTPPR